VRDVPHAAVVRADDLAHAARAHKRLEALHSLVLTAPPRGPRRARTQRRTSAPKHAAGAARAGRGGPLEQRGVRGGAVCGVGVARGRGDSQLAGVAVGLRGIQGAADALLIGGGAG
jgi:hypothetical protein